MSVTFDGDSNVPAGTIVGAKVKGGAEYQIFVPFETHRSDTFTGAGNGTAVDVNEIPCSRFALQVKGTGGAPTSWEVVLEGSLNGTNYTTIASHISGTDADGGVRWQAMPAPVMYFRSRVVSLVLGGATNIIVTVIGEAGS